MEYVIAPSLLFTSPPVSATACVSVMDVLSFSAEKDSCVREIILHSVMDAARVSDWCSERQGRTAQPHAGMSIPLVLTKRGDPLKGHTK